MSQEILRKHAEQFAEGSSFLWLLRELALRSPNYNIHDLAELDERIEAHLDGLRAAGTIAWEICEEELAWEEAGEVFTAAAVAYSIQDDKAIDRVLQVATQSVVLSKGMSSALAWMGKEASMPYIESMIQSEESIIKRMGVSAASIQRIDLGEKLNKLIENGDPIVAGRAIKAVGELGRVDLLDACLANLQHEDPYQRYWAAWSSTLLGDRSKPIAVLSKFDQMEPLHAERACELMGRSMSLEKAQEWLKVLAAEEQYRRLAVIFAGSVGTPVLIPWLINMMTIEELSRVAGSAFTAITGADIVDNQLAGDVPDFVAAEPNEDPKDENVAMDADEDLAWPDVNKVSHWWAEHKGNFDMHTRYLFGYPIENKNLETVLAVAKQPQRWSAAMESALSSPHQPLIEIRTRQ
ncbi:MAG: TIGR02270 family protein [Gammaproteobacteria bacterium]|nr:TIGR02270 family protein [Gammaproteobacteria bacterium]MDH5802718.1 TIGR02270 family protein [Gammaproteobacteria bacterium]